MNMPIFPKLKDIELDEYASDSSYEQYTGIVLDPEDKIFKTVSGIFHDKKEFYEKLSARGYIVRKVFEAKVFDWIEKNAKTTLEAYLMFSTAFSKWKGNNILNDYYTQLLNDIPQLNREKIKGDPNSKGINQAKEESFKDTVFNSLLLEDHKSRFVQGMENWPKYDITVIPSDENGNPLPDKESLTLFKVPLNPSTTKINDFISSNPEFIYQLYSEMAFGDNQIKPNPYFTNDNRANNFILSFNNGNILRQDSKANKKNVSWDTSDNPAVISKLSILNLNKLTNYDRSVDPQTIQLNKAQDAQNQANEIRFTNAADLNAEYQAAEKDLEAQTANKINNKLQSMNKKSKLLRAGWEKYISQEDHDKLEKFEQNKAILALKKLSDSRVQKLFKRYGVDNKTDAYYKLVQEENEFIDSITLQQPNTKQIKQDIQDITDRLKELQNAPYLNNDEKQDQITTLQGKLLRKLGSLKKAQQKIKLDKSKIDTIYSHPDTNPIDAPRTGYIDQPKGAKAKHTTTQADLGVNKGIHSFNKNESLDEEYIPKVDDLDVTPPKHVNYNATISYINQPVNGVITSPGASFDTGGTFLSEQDEHWGWVHEQLNQDLFEGMHLRPEVREALLRIAEKFRQTLGLDIEPVDVYFTGSMANFNFNDASDLDLHLVYDFEQIGINAEILVKYFIAKKQVFNNDYEITIKGVPVEVGVENLNEPIVSSGIYSVVKDGWMIKPEYAAQFLPRPDMKQYYELVQKIETAIESRDSKQIGKVWDELYTIRKSSLKDEGEYGKGNALFKKLRNLGYLDRLKNAYYSSASEELSLEALKDII